MAAIDTCQRRGHLFSRVLALWLSVTSFYSMVLAQTLEVFEPPIVMHDDIKFQWGGHTFNYLLEGETGLFSTALKYEGALESLTAIVGQYPKAGSSLTASETIIPFQNPTNWRADPPQILRTPDGYLHIFAGFYGGKQTGNISGPWGQMRYYRSAAPEDISTLVDRTSLIPNTTFTSFHLRTNMGISKDGNTLVWVVLTDGQDGYSFNTPVMFIAHRVGLDFVFQDPFKYAEAQPLFYPQVAVTDAGPVVVGELWPDPPTHTYSRLIHIDWSGNEIYRYDLSVPLEPGRNMVYDLRPVSPNDWSKLVLAASEWNEPGFTYGIFRFLVYNSQTQTVTLEKVENVSGSMANPGRWVRLNQELSAFVNNPSLGNVYAWAGDFLNGGELTGRFLPGATPIDDGYPLVNYVSVPNPLYGSVPSPGGFYLAVDPYNPDWLGWGHHGPASLLVYRVESAVIDQDLDRLPDRWEETFGFDPFNDSGDQSGCGDADFDNVSNYAEFLRGTSPIDPQDLPDVTVEDGCGLSTEVGYLDVPDDRLPSTFFLYQNHPNPFNPFTTISYHLPKNTVVSVSIHDIMGRLVRTMVKSQQNAGFKSIYWNATNDNGSPVSAGPYLYMLKAGEFKKTKKMVVLK